jgi:hypothetical protein
MGLQQNQTLASTSTPLRGNVCGLLRKLFQEDWFLGFGNLRPNRFPELKPLLRRYPSEFNATVGHYETHRASPHKFGNITLAKIPDPLAGQCTTVVPKLGEWELRDYPLIRSLRIWLRGN